MRAYIEEAKLLVMDDARRLARVEVVSRAFRLCELYSRYEETRRELVELCINSAQPERIAWQLEKFRRSRGDFEAYMDQYLEDDYALLDVILKVCNLILRQSLYGLLSIVQRAAFIL